MMRLARRASLLVALSLLTSAATAHAECAWVLWSSFYSINPVSPIEGLWTPEMRSRHSRRVRPTQVDRRNSLVVSRGISASEDARSQGCAPNRPTR